MVVESSLITRTRETWPDGRMTIEAACAVWVSRPSTSPAISAIAVSEFSANSSLPDPPRAMADRSRSS